MNSQMCIIDIMCFITGKLYVIKFYAKPLKRYAKPGECVNVPCSTIPPSQI